MNKNHTISLSVFNFVQVLEKEYGKETLQKVCLGGGRVKALWKHWGRVAPFKATTGTKDNLISSLFLILTYTSPGISQ